MGNSLSASSSSRVNQLGAWMARKYTQWLAYILLLPLLAVIGGLIVYPLVTSAWISFRDFNPMYGRNVFVGLGNFIDLLSDERFSSSIIITCIFVAITVPAEFLLGLGCALVLYKRIPGGRYFRTIVLLPYVTVPVVVALTFRILLNYRGGLVNYVMQTVGLPPLAWLSHPRLALFSVVIADLWRWSPFATLLLLAGLRSIPNNILEAAEVDGATAGQRFLWVIIPTLKPTILVILLLRMIGTFKVFDLVYMLTEGGPGKATELISFYIFQLGFRTWELGVAAAASYYLLFIILIITVVLLKHFNPE